MPYLLEKDKASAIEGVGTEALVCGDVVCRGTTAKSLSKADANGASLRRGWGIVDYDAASGANVTAYRKGILAGLSGLTIGAQYYLSDTPGAFSSSLPADGSQVVVIGIARTTTELEFDIHLAAIQKQAAATSTAVLA